MQIGVSLSRATVAALDAEAAATGRSRSYVAASRIEQPSSADIVAALQEVEWVLVPGGPEWDSSQWECPWCDFTKSQGHDPMCQRQAALAPFETGAATGDEQ